MITKKADFLIEISWEVANKVGGIYTVIKSKAERIVQNYGKNYLMIGPYFEKNVGVMFEKKEIPEEFAAVIQSMEKEGIKCHFGKWIIDGMSVDTFLVDFRKHELKANEVKRELWENFKVDSYSSEQLFTDCVAFGNAAGILIEKLAKVIKGKKVLHCHEWQAGASILYLKKKGVDIGTVFTTHSTVVGRHLSTEGVNFYDNLEKIDADKESYRMKDHAKHLLEKACAKNADVFTTVSEITGIEAKHFLGKKPDVLLLNGLDMSTMPTLEERSIQHSRFKEQIRRFVVPYFFPYYRFNIKKTLFYFIAGRYEFQNKGVDVFIESLGELNKLMRKNKSDKTVVAFIWIPAKVKDIKHDILENKIAYDGIDHYIDEILPDVKSSIIRDIVRGKMPVTHDLIKGESIYELKKKMVGFRKKGKPPVVTHNLENEGKDRILSALNKAGLNNSTQDMVKVIFYPIYLTGADGLLNMNYSQCIEGSHLGVFPSYYEPWGYTPLETAALGVPAVTTDLAGFGRYLMKHKKEKGIFILKRQNRKKTQYVKDLAKYMFDFSKLDQRGRIELKLEAKELADMADWKIMIENYIEAHNKAVSK